MTTDKRNLQLLVHVLAKCGLKHVVICPGSRSAPLVIAFNSKKEIRKWVVPDERVAGYYALGMARQLNEPVAIVTTSGTAVLNLGPALCEAYYQKIPLIAITADRPASHLDRGENQTIRQEGVFAQYIRHQLSYPADDLQADLSGLAAQISEAFQRCKYPVPGPIHFNVPIQEPLYQHRYDEELIFDFKIPQSPRIKLSEETAQKLSAAWGAQSRKMILCGVLQPDAETKALLAELAVRPDTVVLAEALSNLQDIPAIHHIDGALSAMPENHIPLAIPDLVITLEGQILSKAIKQFLKQYPPRQHWHISRAGDKWDYFGSLKAVFASGAAPILKPLTETAIKQNNFNSVWQQAQTQAEANTQSFLSRTAFSDLKVFAQLLPLLPPNTVLHAGNSTPARYINSFRLPKGVLSLANRGTSGIDGCLSAAAGASVVDRRLHVAVVGDQTAFYDSNAFWHTGISGNFKAIVINNGGGNIFRWLNGATAMEHFTEYQEAAHQMDFEFLARQFGLEYYLCAASAELEFLLKDFLQLSGEKPALLEIKTNNEQSADVYLSYLQALKNKNG